MKSITNNWVARYLIWMIRVFFKYHTPNLLLYNSSGNYKTQVVIWNKILYYLVNINKITWQNHMYFVICINVYNSSKKLFYIYNVHITLNNNIAYTVFLLCLLHNYKCLFISKNIFLINYVHFLYLKQFKLFSCI